jgi:hypothetical protein
VTTKIEQLLMESVTIRVFKGRGASIRNTAEHIRNETVKVDESSDSEETLIVRARSVVVDYVQILSAAPPLQHGGSQQSVGNKSYNNNSKQA